MFHLTESTLLSPGGPFTYLLHTPVATQRAPHPALLLTFSLTRQASFADPPYNIPARVASEAGHYVASFDLPNHGENINLYGEGITGMCAAFVAGADPFAQFIAQGQAVIDHCLAQGIGAHERVYVCGTSRAGYCALRLAAADGRIAGVAGFAPVTDWRILAEFAQVRNDKAVAALALENAVAALAEQAVFLSIGNRDARVGTDACVRFALRLLEAQTAGAGTGSLALHVVEEEGHRLADHWRAAGAQFLLRQDGPPLTQ
jgi:dienelactone hydrolase